MPSAQRSTTPIEIDIDIVEGRYAQLGDYTVGFETFKQHVDTAPYFRGLPDDHCPCAHLGYVTAGQITFRYAEGEETFVEGTPTWRRRATSPPSPREPASWSSPAPRIWPR
jgi:hypothetical protein